MEAAADPLFMRPLAVPEWRGAISMGMAHMGPMVTSRKKKASERKMQDRRLCTKSTGIKETSESTMPRT